MLRKYIKKFNKLTSSQTMVLGFALLILVGAFLLSLPISSKDGHSTNFLDSLFTATSAVCVTGLVAVDTATHWNLFGQIIIISLIQIGGLGFMTITTLFALIMKKKINLRERLLIQESLNQVDLSGLVRLTRHVLLMTFSIEGIGALILSTKFIPQFGLVKGLWYSAFHSISAFCNAGFDLMGSVSGKYSSLISYVESPTISITVCILIILGGLGFPVIIDIIKNKKLIKLNIHSRVVLTSTCILVLGGMAFIFIMEYKNPKTLGNLSFQGKILASLFQSVTTRTAGFNTVDLTAMTQGTTFVMIILMFIGASPASTGGGVKTTTLATLILTVKSFILGKEDIEAYNRKISNTTVKKSVGIFFIAIVVVVMGTLLINITQDHFDLVESGYEVVSAFATVGTTLGGSPTLNIAGKILIILFMFAGRVGSLTIFLAIAYKNSSKKQLIKYPEGKIIVG